MEYQKYDLGSYKLHVIKTDKFKTVSVRVNMKRQLAKEEITKRNILNDILLQSSSNFKTKKELAIEVENLYSASVGSSTFIAGNFSVLKFNLRFLNEKYTEEGMMSSTIKFFMDLLFKPNIQNKEFDKKSFDIAVLKLKEELNTAKENPKQYSIDRMLEHMDPKSPISYSHLGYLSDLESITPKNLYDYYEDVLRSDLVDVVVIGDVCLEEIKKLIEENMAIKTLKKPIKSAVIEHKKILKRPKVYKETMKLNQSKLSIGCKMKDLTDFERDYVTRIYSLILGAGPDSKLFRNVREKNSLCYYISTSPRVLSNVLLIVSGIDKKDFKKAVTLIKKEFNDMKKGIFTDEEIDNTIRYYQKSVIEALDNPNMIIDYYLDKEYYNSDLINERIEKIKGVTKEDIVKLANKIEMDTIYLLEGNDEE